MNCSFLPNVDRTDFAIATSGRCELAQPLARHLTCHTKGDTAVYACAPCMYWSTGLMSVFSSGVKEEKLRPHALIKLPDFSNANTEFVFVVCVCVAVHQAVGMIVVLSFVMKFEPSVQCIFCI